MIEPERDVLLQRRLYQSEGKYVMVQLGMPCSTATVLTQHCRNGLRADHQLKSLLKTTPTDGVLRQEWLRALIADP
jgi:hypothetical protein